MRLALRTLSLLALGACSAPLDGVLAPDDAAPATVDGGTPAPGPRERCNGLDDDGDGKIDEGCPIRTVVDVDRGRAAPWRWVSDDGATVAFTRTSTVVIGSNQSVWIAERGRGERMLLDGYSAPVLSASSRRLAAYRSPIAPDFVHRIVELDVATGAVLRTISIPSGMPGPTTYVYGPNYVGDELAITVVDIPSNGLEVYRVGDGDRLTPLVPGTPAFRLRSDGRAGVFTGGTGGVSRLYSFALDPAPVARALYDAPERHELYPLALHGDRAIVQESSFFDGECRLMLVDLAGGALTPLERCASAAGLGARLLVLEDAAPGGRLTARTLPDGVERPLTTYPSFATAPILVGTTLAWLDNRAGTFDVYQIDLSDFDAGDFFPEGRP